MDTANRLYLKSLPQESSPLVLDHEDLVAAAAVGVAHHEAGVVAVGLRKQLRNLKTTILVADEESRLVDLWWMIEIKSIKICVTSMIIEISPSFIIVHLLLSMYLVPGGQRTASTDDQLSRGAL